MPFLLLLLLTLVLLPDKWSAPLWLPSDTPARPHDLITSAALTWLGVALIAAFARFIAARVIYGIADYPGHRERLLRDYGRLRTYHIVALLGSFLLSVYGLGWGWTVQALCQYGGQMVPGAELVILAPLFVALVLSWVVFYDSERALHGPAEPDVTEPAEPYWSRAAYVGFHVRQNLALICAPLLLLLLMKGLHRAVPESETGIGGWIIPLSGVLLALAIIVGMPWLLRLALGLKPMPPSPLRSRLEGTARRLRFRCSNILTWDTHNGVANAMVAGVIPQVRYVILTDRLMAELTPDEVEAVFGHEMGHAKHHHMLYYLGFLFVSLFLVGVLWDSISLCVFGHQSNIDTTLAALPLVAILGGYIFVVFGFLSRRCERQADVFGCRVVSCDRPDCCGHEGAADLVPVPAALSPRGVFDAVLRPVRPLRGTGLCPTGIRTFIAALEKVALLNGISRDKPGWLSSWQHSTIARRVQFLQNVLTDRTLERRFQRRVLLVKAALFAGLIAGLGALTFTFSKFGPDEGEAKSERHYAPGGDVPTPPPAGHTAPSE